MQAKFPASNNKSVIPPNAETTTIISVVNALSLTISIALLMFSEVATDDPPNFNTFMILIFYPDFYKFLNGYSLFSELLKTNIATGDINRQNP